MSLLPSPHRNDTKRTRIYTAALGALALLCGAALAYVILFSDQSDGATMTYAGVVGGALIVCGIQTLAAAISQFLRGD